MLFKKEKISLIIPCFNEEESIPIFYEEANKVSKKMKGTEFEMIFVNDGSGDKTLDIMRQLSKKDKRVRYISFSRNFGKEAAMYAGLEAVTGDYAAIMDADMQDPPEKLIEMYHLIKEEGYDCVALYTESHEGYNFIRKALTNCWYKLIDKISDSHQVPGARDFRLMTRQMVDAILEMKEYNRYTKGMFGFVGFHTKWLSYNAPDRRAGTSKFNLRKLVKYAMEGVMAFSTTPLLLSAYVGMIFCILAFFAIIFIIVKTLIWGDPTSGWPSMVCIIIFVSGIQLFFLGIIGMYLSKIYLEIKHRPVYIVKETEKTKR
ncbi:MAG: glycosyltransferase family 2 protein [Bacilli bacterium]|nr:glycosyltransferase family 2 protein [Bacilli bacterium]